jgi:hypothetical protein
MQLFKDNGLAEKTMRIFGGRSAVVHFPAPAGAASGFRTPLIAAHHLPSVGALRIPRPSFKLPASALLTLRCHLAKDSEVPVHLNAFCVTFKAVQYGLPPGKLQIVTVHILRIK